MNIVEQLRVTAVLILYGMSLAATIDTYELTIRRYRLHWLVIVGDFVVGTSSAVLFFYSIYTTSNGEFRVFYLVIATFGVFFYRFAIRKWYCLIVEKLIIMTNFIYRVCCRTCYILIVWPIKVVVWRTVKKLVRRKETNHHESSS